MNALRITVLDLRSGGEAFSRDLDQDVIRIGRAKTCELFIPDEGEKPELSRKHAWLERTKDGYYLFDGDRDSKRSSANGTFLGEARIPPGRGEPVRDGTFAFLGDRFRLGFQVYDPSQTQPGPAPSMRPRRRPPEPVDEPQERPDEEPEPAVLDPGPSAAELAARLRDRCRAQLMRWGDRPAVARTEAARELIAAALSELDPDLRAEVEAALRGTAATAGAATPGEPSPPPAEPVRGAAAVERPDGASDPLRVAERLLGRAPRSPEAAADTAGRALDMLDEFLRFLVRGIRHYRDFDENISVDASRVLDRRKNPLLNTREPARVRDLLLDPEATPSAAAAQAMLTDLLRRLYSHQLGVFAMYDHAPGATLRILDPERIEARLSAAWRVLTSRNAAAWTLYRELFTDLRENPSKLFHAVWPELRRRYIAEIERDTHTGDEAKART
jgi:predicted component of type VI protein secretion system